MKDKNVLTIGELAKLANTTVRTLQYYDKENLIKPSSYTEGGRRLYVRNDLSIIHQIITLKSLGLSLKDIKGKLIKVESGTDILNVLEQQEAILSLQISQINKVLESIKMLKVEVKSTNSIDWEKYSQMMSLIRNNDEYYWVLNFLDKDILSRITDVHTEDVNNDFQSDWLKELLTEVVTLQNSGVTPRSEQGQQIALRWWESINKYTKGDPTLLMQLYKFYSSSTRWPEEFGIIQVESKEFLEAAIEHFLKEAGIELPKNLAKETM